MVNISTEKGSNMSLMSAIIEYPVVSKNGATLGFAATYGDAMDILEYHFPASVRAGATVEKASLGKAKRVQANGFTFASGWVEQSEGDH